MDKDSYKVSPLLGLLLELLTCAMIFYWWLPSYTINFSRRIFRCLPRLLLALTAWVFLFSSPTRVLAGAPSCAGGVCVSLTASPNFVAPGSLVTYVVTATNNLTSYKLFQLLMPVPDHMTAKPHPGFTCSAPLASGDCPSGAVLTRTNYHAIDPGKTDSQTLAMRINNGAGAPPDGTVIPAAVTVEVFDAASASATTNVRVDAAGGLMLAASADVVSVAPGQSVTYTLSFGNRSAAALTGTKLRASVPAGTTLQSTDGVVAGSQIDWSLGTLPAGSHGQRHFTVQINAPTLVGTLFVMPAELSDDSERIADAGSADVVVQGNVSLSLTAAPDPMVPGDLVTYVVTATNNLTSYKLFQLLMPVPDHMTAKPHPGFTCSAPLASGDCPSGAVLTRTNYHAIDPGKTDSQTLAMRIDSGAGAPPGGTVIPAAVTVEAFDAASASATTNVRVDAAGGLMLAASADVVSVAPGQSVTYTLSFGNRSAAALTGTKLRASVPAGTTLQSTDGVVAGSQIDWSLGTLPAGSHGQRHFTVQINAPTPVGTLFVMPAELSDDSERIADAGSADVVVQGNVSLSLTAAPDPVVPGDLVSYVVTATNNLTSYKLFQLLMPVPDHMTAKPHPGFTCSAPLASGDCPSGAVLTRTNYHAIDPGKTDSQTLAMRIDSGAGAPPAAR